jgi:hypothetical protein
MTPNRLPGHEIEALAQIGDRWRELVAKANDEIGLLESEGRRYEAAELRRSTQVAVDQVMAAARTKLGLPERKTPHRR